MMLIYIKTILGFIKLKWKHQIVLNIHCYQLEIKVLVYSQQELGLDGILVKKLKIAKNMVINLKFGPAGGGYIFKSDFIFKEYIEELNLIKESSEKGSAMYLISKILMNSLYGRFGLNPFLSRHYFVTKEG
uniref:DNA-directed DNA polymerase n=1 Tax=Porodaedalea pini TaxID=108901 RepID=A0A5B9R8W3_9AGAM|nr:DNA polymerase family B [Porodaedalea pini]QEG56931.1 DNA polymerase family B [Porodaedalea pini]